MLTRASSMTALTQPVLRLAGALVLALFAGCALAAQSPRQGEPQPQQQRAPSVPVTPSRTVTPQSPPSTPSEAQDARDSSPWWENPDWWQVGLTVLGFAAAVVAIWHERSAVYRTQRADILLDQAGLIVPDGQEALLPTGHPRPETRVQLLFRNFGPTRADRVSIRVGLRFGNQPAHDNPPTTEFAIAAGGSIPVGFPTLGDIASPEAYAHMIAGIQPLQFYGTISYFDAFGKPHSVNLEGVWDARDKTFVLEKQVAD